MRADVQNISTFVKSTFVELISRRLSNSYLNVCRTNINASNSGRKREQPMRVQLAMNVDDLDESIDFYTKMFATPPAKIKDGYANFEVASPPLKLVLFENPGHGGSLNHLGVEVETAEEVEAAEARIVGAGLDTSGVDDTVCCYAAKTETWIEGPQTRWEWYVKTGDTDVLVNTPVLRGAGFADDLSTDPASSEDDPGVCCS